jgi:hypothetical protein
MRIDIDRDNPNRKFGMGQLPGNDFESRKNGFIGFLRQAAQCPSWQLPVLDNVTIHYDGPLSDVNLNQTFSATINPLNASTENLPAGASAVDTTFAEPGKFQTFNLICGIQWMMEFEPQCFTALGNAWTPANYNSSAAPPISPDDFNSAAGKDIATNGPLGLQAGETMVQSVLEWGWWADLAAYYMARGYNLQWKWGNRQLLVNDRLRYTMFVPSNAQDGSASNSDVDVNAFVRRTNNYYRNILFAGSSSGVVFLPADRSRLGNMTTGAAGDSVFRPSRNYEVVGATYGGTVVRQYLRGNSEFRRLSNPFLIAPGIPIGLKAVQTNPDDAAFMRNYLSATQGLGGAVPVADITPDVNIPSGLNVTGTAGVTGAEPSFDTPVAAQSIYLNTDRKIFKGGSWKLTVAFKGFELTPAQAAQIADPNFQTALASECGCACKTV